MTSIVAQAGPIALVGSGEYLPVMEETDRVLLEHVGGPGRARVVAVPTASGLENASSTARWIRMGLEHFRRLGAQVETAAILNRDDAHDPQWTPLLEAADFFYFSGGNPQHVIETFANSPAWATIKRRHQVGAVLAGCSAGAMAICGQTARFRALRASGKPEWMEALGIVPRVIVMPHFDRMAGFIGQEGFTQLLATVPIGTIVVGVDEETALLRLGPAAKPGVASQWQVAGRQRVSIFTTGQGGQPAVYEPGAQVSLLAD